MTTAERDATPLLIAAVILVLVGWWWCLAAGGRGRGREGFVSERARAVHAASAAVFAGGDATYSEYKKRVPGADPVQYSDVRGLARAGALTPRAVEGVLG